MDNRFFKLPFHFDQTALMQDLLTSRGLSWQPHFNQQDYAGDWSCLALRSVSGREDDVNAHPGQDQFIDTPLMTKCSYFRQICDQLRCEKESIRLLALAPGSVIREHTDRHTSYPYGLFRLHIPIQTVEAVRFRVDGVDLPMRAGECWYANFDLPHSVQNEGASERVHLVIDCRRNTWSDILFREVGYDFDEEARTLDYSLVTKRRMLAELERMDTETARQLVSQLRHELGDSAY
jgi:Aspartyl/Asparaginyl beta-hydroxylase